MSLALRPDPARSFMLPGDLHLDYPIGSSHNPAARAAKFAQRMTALTTVYPGYAAIAHVGDLTEIGDPNEYTQAQTWWNALEGPKIAVPGNHDVTSAAPGAGVITDWETYIGPRNLTLDTTYFRIIGMYWYNADNGLGTAGGATFLNAALAATSLPCILLFHFPPRNTVPASVAPYTSALSSPATTNLTAAIDNYPNLKAVVHGHTHTSFDVTGFMTTIAGSSRSILSVNAGAMTYVSDGDQKSPLIAPVLTVLDDGIETRLRNIGKHCWIPRTRTLPRAEWWPYA